MYRLFAGIFSVSMVSAGSAAEKPRLAVIWQERAADLGVLIEADLSAREAFEVVDRSAIDAVLEQFELSATGLSGEARQSIDVLGADGLLFIDVENGGLESEPAELTFRLVAAESGVIVASYAPPPGVVLEAAPETARQIVDHFAPAARNLDDLELLTPITLLNLRTAEGVTNFRERQTLGRISTLLSRRLGGVPGVVLLERDRMGELAFEKLFAGEATGKFWAGAFLLDGTLKSAGSGFELELRLTPPGGERITTSVKGTDGDLPSIADEAVAAITGNLGGKQPGTTPEKDLAAEAAALRQEAEWAFHTGLFRQATEAAEASWILSGTDEPATIQLLTDAQISRCEVLRYRAVYTENYGDFVLTANALLSNLINYRKVYAGGPQHLTVLQRALEAANRVLFYGYRHGLHLENGHGDAMATLRSSAREIFREGQALVDEVSLSRRRFESEFTSWDKTVEKAGGLWFDTAATGEAFLEERNREDPNFVPFPVRGYDWANYRPDAPWVVPPGIDWSGRFDLEDALTRWLALGDRWRGDPDPATQVKGWMVHHVIRNWFDRYYLWKHSVYPHRELTPRLEATVAPVLDTSPQQVFDLVKENTDRFAGDSTLHFYLRPLFRAAKELPRTGSGAWANDDGRFFSEFCLRLFRESEFLQPHLSEFLFFTGSRFRHLDHSDGPNNFRLPDYPGSIKAFDTYRKRLMENDPELNLIHFRDELSLIALDRGASERTSHPEAVLTLSDPVHIGYPDRELPSGALRGTKVFFGNDPEEEAWYGFFHNKILQPDNTRELDRIEIRRFNFVTREEQSEMIPIDDGFLGGLTLKEVLPYFLKVTPSSLLIFANFKFVGEPMAGYLVDIDRKTKAVSWHRVSSLGAADGGTYVDGEILYFHQTRKPTANGGGTASTAERSVVRIYAYDSRENELKVLANTARRPAETFLDDRPGFRILRFGPGPDGRPLLSASFPAGRREGSSAINTLEWNPATGDWETATVEKFSRWWSGMNSHSAGGHFLTTRASGNPWLHEKDGTRPFYGFFHDAQYLRQSERFWMQPIGSQNSKGLIRNRILQWVVTPDLNFYNLLVRLQPDGTEVPILRCYQSKFGRAHYDLVLNLENLPKVYRNLSGLPAEASPEIGYQWLLVRWKHGVALRFRGKEQRNFYLIREDEIAEQLRKLHAIRGELGDLETFPESEWRYWDRLSGDFKPGRHAVEKAILEEDVESLRKFVRDGLPWDSMLGRDSLSPLCLAAAEGKLTSLKTLREAGADIDQACHGVPPLNFAVRGRHLDCIDYLFDQGAKVDPAISMVCHPIIWEALETGDDRVFELVWKRLGRSNRSRMLETVSGLMHELGIEAAWRQAEKLRKADAK